MKILILCMSCNQDIFKYQELVCRNTWIKCAKDLNIDIYIYTTSNKDYIDNDIIYCNCLDDLNNTFEKTIKAFSQIDYNKYDYIVRTNLTTYINCNLLLKYCVLLKQNNIDVSCGDMAIKNNKMLYRGNSLILAPKIIKYIIDNKEYITNDINYKDLHDDDAISKILENLHPLSIHNSSLRYVMDNMRKNHPYNINNINNTNEILSKLYGIIFISFRLNESTEYSRYNELALCYYIDNIINKLNKINI